jgi:hypothetical protein
MPRAWLPFAVVGLVAGAQESVPIAKTRTVVGELIRVDLSRESVTVKTGDKEQRELELAVDAGTRLVSQGRALKITELKPGERTVAVFSEDVVTGRRRALVVKLGASSFAVPDPDAKRPRQP